MEEGRKVGIQEGEIKGRKAGFQEGEIKGLIALIYDGILPKDVAASRAEKKYSISPEDFQKMLDSYNPDDELMQG